MWPFLRVIKFLFILCISKQKNLYLVVVVVSAVDSLDGDSVAEKFEKTCFELIFNLIFIYSNYIYR